MSNQELDLDSLEPSFYGPTWQKNPDGSWYLPERTLGWQIAAWCSKYLLGEEGQPWDFTDEQLRFLLWWYAVDENGRFIYRKGVLQRLKGWGKDPLLAVICLVEFVGPSQFGGWTNDGSPWGVHHPRAWVQIAAVSREQTRNTAALFPSLMSDRLKRDYGIKEGIERIRANHGRQVLEVVTSSFRALEGGRSTFVVLNETHHWVRGNNGDKMYETIDGNSTKAAHGRGRYLAITNAYLPGESSVAEQMREAYEKIAEGRSVDIGFLYDSIEAHPSTPLTEEALRIVIPKIRGDATWLNIDAIVQSVMDATIAPSRSRRMWLNQIVAEEDALYSPAQWKAIEDEDAVLAPGDEIVMGFDGSKSDDDTALVALRVSDNCAFVLHHQYKPDGPRGEGWQVNRMAVDSAVHEAFQTYTVRGFYADVAYWESYTTEWAEIYGEQLEVKAQVHNAVAWDMRASLKRVTMAHERLMRTIFDEKMTYDGDFFMRKHALNAMRKTNNFGLYFSKESPESPRKVDIYAALMLAHEALYDLRTKGKKQREHTREGYFL